MIFINEEDAKNLSIADKLYLLLERYEKYKVNFKLEAERVNKTLKDFKFKVSDNNSELLVGTLKRDDTNCCWTKVIVTNSHFIVYGDYIDMVVSAKHGGSPSNVINWVYGSVGNGCYDSLMHRVVAGKDRDWEREFAIYEYLEDFLVWYENEEDDELDEMAERAFEHVNNGLCEDYEQAFAEDLYDNNLHPALDEYPGFGSKPHFNVVVLHEIAKRVKEELGI